MGKEALVSIKRNIETVIVGKGDVADKLLICLIAGGHALIEDMPGLGKTSLVAALAAGVDCAFARIQFTPDVLPSDVTGFTAYHPVTGEERFAPGAVMCNILLADELNRTSPKTQSALLQAMQEGMVTVDGVTRALPKPFMVCATQNPVEQAGTYPLPEAQLDRFMMRVSMGYPIKSDEVEILERNKRGAVKPHLKPAANAADVLAIRKEVDAVICSPAVMAYVVDICAHTRGYRDVELGISPRGAIALMRASMGYAFLNGRDYVLPDDVTAMARVTLAHRLVLNSQAYMRGVKPEDIIEKITRDTSVPAVSGR